jgi:hypothetical protein
MLWPLVWDANMRLAEQIADSSRLVPYFTCYQQMNQSYGEPSLVYQFTAHFMAQQAQLLAHARSRPRMASGPRRPITQRTGIEIVHLPP